MKSIKTPNYNWLYFENPDKDDLAAIQKIFTLHPVVLSEFNSPTYRPRVNQYENYTFMVLHFPVYDKQSRTPKTGEVDVLINDQYLITSCNYHQRGLFQFFEKTRKNQASLTGNHQPENTWALLLMAFDALMNACFPKLDHISSRLETIEENIFQGREKEMVQEISLVKRDILNFRRSIKPQRSILESLAATQSFKNNQDLKTRINDIIGTNIRIWNVLQNHKEVMDSLEATNDSLFSYKLNQNMKALAIISIIFLPSTLAASLFGANTIMPIQNFWQALGITLILMVMMLIIVKLKKWL
ncbi:MAG: hypothetical protein GF332_02855 [Candidatus Moranbacteria bacterium]|nr:hypothetical protein [Candidatus Moranbacteria bacterium]